jgi:hypothetical protein
MSDPARAARTARKKPRRRSGAINKIKRIEHCKLKQI